MGGGAGGGYAIETVEDVVGLRSRTSNKGESGSEHHARTIGHRAMAEGGSKSREELRATLPRKLLRQHYLPPRHQGLPRPSWRPFRLRHR